MLAQEQDSDLKDIKTYVKHIYLLMAILPVSLGVGLIIGRLIWN
jgi:hypothetical protein